MDMMAPKLNESFNIRSHSGFNIDKEIVYEKIDSGEIVLKHRSKSKSENNCFCLK